MKAKPNTRSENKLEVAPARRQGPIQVRIQDTRISEASGYLSSQL